MNHNELLADEILTHFHNIFRNIYRLSSRLTLLLSQYIRDIRKYTEHFLKKEKKYIYRTSLGVGNL